MFGRGMIAMSGAETTAAATLFQNPMIGFRNNVEWGPSRCQVSGTSPQSSAAQSDAQSDDLIACNRTGPDFLLGLPDAEFEASLACPVSRSSDFGAADARFREFRSCVFNGMGRA